jgi:hypothetical protein
MKTLFGSWNYNIMNKIIPGLIVLLTLSACSGVATQTPTAMPVSTETPISIETPIPTEMSTPLPEPVILIGTGDHSVDIEDLGSPYLMQATHTGQSNFVVTSYAGSKKLDVLINATGDYSGTKLLDLSTTRFDVKADGTWQLHLLPLASFVRVQQKPGTVTGTGDDVIAIQDFNADLLKASYSGDSDFVIAAWDKTGKKQIINETGAYTGTGTLPDGTTLLEITAKGPWSIEITGK